MNSLKKKPIQIYIEPKQEKALDALADEDDTHHGNAIAIYPILLKSSRYL